MAASLVYICCLPACFTPMALNELFAPYGTVLWSRLVQDTNAETHTYGYVEMAHAQAQDAIRGLHGSLIEEQKLTVHLSNDILPHRGS